MCSSVPGRGSRFLEVIFLAIDEQDNVSVLLDRARFTEVRELRPLVVALLDLAWKSWEAGPGSGY